MIERDLMYRLLTSEQGPRLRHLTVADGQSYKIAQAVAWLRVHYMDPLRIERLAQGDHIAPIPGTRHVARLEENAGADAIELTAGQLARLDAIRPAVGDRYADMTPLNR